MATAARLGPGYPSVVRGVSWRARWALIGVVLVAGCAVHRQPAAATRINEYLAVHREVPPAIVQAMEQGHVAIGMDSQQVLAVLGEPVRRATGAGSPRIERWLYPRHALHQDHFRLGSSSLYRLIFVDGRLELIEAL